MENIPE